MKLAQVDPGIIHQNGHVNQDLDALKANRMLHTLGDEEIPVVLDAGQWVMFEPEETVCRQATPVGEILILADGRAKAEVSGASNGKFTAVLNLLKPGDDIGLLSLVDGAPHSATVTALEHLRALSVPMANMRGLLQAHPEWYRVLAEVAVSRLRNSSVWLQALM